MRKGFKIAGGIILVLFVLAIMGKASEEGGGGTSAQEAPKEVVKFTSVELFKAYEANEVATDERIKGRIVEVAGTVQSIDKDAFDNIIVRLATPNQFMAAAMQMKPTEKTKAISLSKGVKLSVQCEKVARIVGMPHGSDCIIIDAAAKKT